MQNRIAPFRHVALAGTHYEVGRQLGELVKSSPVELERLARLPEWDKCNLQVTDEALSAVERHCPGLSEEIQGMADAAGLTQREMMFYAISYANAGHCSQFAISPSATKDGYMLVGRSYEWSDSDDHDRQLLTTRVTGKAAHTGFSLFHFGRLDGLNEHGLCVTMTGQPFIKEPGSGVAFWVLVRAMLDSCQSVQEALELAESIPTSYGYSILLADKTGAMALIDSAGEHRYVRSADGNNPFLWSTNHFTTPDMAQHQSRRMWQSVARYKAIEHRLNAAGQQIDDETVKQLLTDKYPAGVCCHHYSDGLGTLWSMVFDVTAGSIDICFGSPQHNPWRKFGPTGSKGVQEYEAVLPDEPADADVWRPV